MSTAVVTGLGVAAPNGFGADDYWTAIRSAVCGIGRISRFDPSPYPARLAGEIKDFDPTEHLPARLIPQTDRVTQLSLVAAEQAFADAGVWPDELGEFDMGVVTASSSGGFEFGQNELRNLWLRGGEYVSAYQSFAWFYAVNSGQISIRNGMRGPSGVLVSDQSGGLDAIAHARRHVRNGTRLMVCGGVDATLCPWGWTGLLASGRLSRREEPLRAYMPFDPRAEGHVPGEGGALLVVEDAEAARRRGAARIYGEIAGYAATFDPPAGSGRPPGLRRAIELALADAAADPSDVDVVFADAAAVPELDVVEVDAITAVFGAFGVPVTAPKAAIGRLYSGAGSLDVATALLAIQHDMLPPTANVRPDERYELDLVTGEARTGAPVRVALVLARGHGGFNSAVVVREHADGTDHSG